MRLYNIIKASNDSQILSDEQLEQLHFVLLSMLKDMKQICDKNGIKFILIGGSAIGALRHKGFIPWDDDVDVAMTRTDYEIFKRIVRKKYKNKYYIGDPRDRCNWSRVRPTLFCKNTVYRTFYDYNNHSGVFIDIFVIENTFNDPILRLIHGVGCYFWGFLYSCRNNYENRKRIRSLSYNIVFKIKFEIKNAIAFCLSFLPVQDFAKWTDKWYSLCKNDNSKYVSIPSDGPHFFGGLTLRKNLCEVIEVVFEGIHMNLPKDYDSYLRGIYGNYMEIPPEDKRVRDMCLEFDPGPYKISDRGT